ncbi:hypothetical protein KSP39_PZI024147 [Platanthera zijinensis]|uniref:Uncharacterized protein n=1 Tax=Platanthera zijinensis TaxID=2320716 RepID=A0AAP0AU53_9ASPA
MESMVVKILIYLLQFSGHTPPWSIVTGEIIPSFSTRIDSDAVLCGFCSSEPAMVYCRADSTRLCIVVIPLPPPSAVAFPCLLRTLEMAENPPPLHL